MEPEVSLPCSQDPSTGPYSEPDHSSQYHSILSKIDFNIIHSPTSWFCVHLYTPLGTTINYSAIADRHKLLHAKSSSACSVFNSRSLATASIIGDSSASSSQATSSQPPMQFCSQLNWTIAPSLLSLSCRAQMDCQPSTDRIVPVVIFIIPRRGPHRKHRSLILT
jgi:hypothetical protein